MINLREHFRLSAIYTFFAAFPALLQLIVYPIIEGESRLGATDFGYLAITEAIIAIVFLICTFGMGSGLARFYYDYKDNRENYNRLVSTVISGIIGRGFLLLGIAIIAAPFIGSLFAEPALQNFGAYGPSLVIAGLNRSIITSMLALYRNEKRLNIFVLVSLMSGLLRSGFQLTGVLYYDMSFMGYVWGTALGGSIIAIGVIVYSYYRCGFHYKKAFLRELFPFARPLFFSDLIVWGLLFADRFFLLRTPGDLGIYDNAMKFAIGIQLIIQGLSNAIQPEIFRFLRDDSKGNNANVKTLCNLFLAESIGIIILAILPAMLFITLFYETQLTMSAGLVTIIFVRFILTSQYKVFAMPVMYAKKTKIFFYINSVVLLLNIGLNWMLVPVFGYYGSITAFFAAYFLQVLLFFIIQQRVLPVDWNIKKVLYFPLGIVFTAIVLEFAKIFLNADPFLTSSVFIMLATGGMLILYRHELKDLRKILFSK
ncbi:MAG: oligosaccharide flippase family protein [Bacteroidales bacterium]